MVLEMPKTEKETFDFQAEVKNILHLMVNSLYSNKEIFLRELISNASDAIDRLRFAALSNGSLLEEKHTFAIHINCDTNARTITISDNGIGMSREEVIAHIGTIAKSGTREFLNALTSDQQKNSQLIGQFGVGFYSAFVVAEKVILTTRRADLPAQQSVCWTSEGDGFYTLEAVEKSTYGTDITLVLRDGEEDFLTTARLQAIVHKYSEHISVPIFVSAVENDTAEAVNQASALWVRAKSDISESEYQDFYRQLTHAYDEPLTYLHSHMEGTSDYYLLLYVPSSAPYDLWSRDYQHRVKLYVHRVFIMEGSEQIMPRYLRFVSGVIDSWDLPLNVSREILQNNHKIAMIKATATKKVLGTLTDLAAHDPVKYTRFWQAFGRVLKEGIADDVANRETLSSLLRFASTYAATETQNVAFDEYLARMKAGQDKIYYLTAENFATAKNSPLLEVFNEKEIEVLLLSDPVDTILGNELHEYKGVALQSISKGSIDLSNLESEQEKEAREQSASDLQNLAQRLQTVLADKVKEVRITTRLTTSPACLVVDEYAMDPSLQRLLKGHGQSLPAYKSILEINPSHPLISKMNYENSDERFANLAHILFDQSILSRGDALDNPIIFVQRLNELLAQL